MTDKERIAELEAEVARLRGAVRDYCQGAKFDVEAFRVSLSEALWECVKTVGLIMVGIVVGHWLWDWSHS